MKSKIWNKSGRLVTTCCIILQPQLMMHADADNIIILYYCHQRSSFISHAIHHTELLSLIITAILCFICIFLDFCNVCQSSHQSLYQGSVHLSLWCCCCHHDHCCFDIAIIFFIFDCILFVVVAIFFCHHCPFLVL